MFEGRDGGSVPINKSFLISALPQIRTKTELFVKPVQHLGSNAAILCTVSCFLDRISLAVLLHG